MHPSPAPFPSPPFLSPFYFFPSLLSSKSYLTCLWLLQQKPTSLTQRFMITVSCFLNFINYYRISSLQITSAVPVWNGPIAWPPVLLLAPFLRTAHQTSPRSKCASSKMFFPPFTLLMLEMFAFSRKKCQPCWKCHAQDAMRDGYFKQLNKITRLLSLLTGSELEPSCFYESLHAESYIADA